MISRLANNVIFAPITPFSIRRPPEIQEAIKANWSKFEESNKDKIVYNGDVIYVTDIKTKHNTFILEIGKGKYSDMLFAKASGKIITHSLFCASYIKTTDDQIGFVFDNGNRLNTIGGMADISDMVDGLFDPERCLARELCEELGVNIRDDKLFCSFSAKYLKHVGASQNTIPVFPVGVLYEILSNLPKEELENELRNAHANVKERGIKPVFIEKSKLSCVSSFENRVGYIDELCELIALDK